MPDFEITSRSAKKFSVRVSNCTPEHAQTVFDQLLVEPTAPSDLILTELEAEPPVKRTVVDRLLGR